MLNKCKICHLLQLMEIGKQVLIEEKLKSLSKTTRSYLQQTSCSPEHELIALEVWNTLKQEHLQLVDRRQQLVDSATSKVVEDVIQKEILKRGGKISKTRLQPFVGGTRNKKILSQRQRKLRETQEQRHS